MKQSSNLRKISLRPQKVRKVVEKIAEVQFSRCCLFQHWIRSSTKRTHTQGGSPQRGKIYESSLSEPSWSWQEQAGNAAVMTQAAKVLLRCVERGLSPSCTASPGRVLWSVFMFIAQPHLAALPFIWKKWIIKRTHSLMGFLEISEGKRRDQRWS